MICQNCGYKYKPTNAHSAENCPNCGINYVQFNSIRHGILGNIRDVHEKLDRTKESIEGVGWSVICQHLDALTVLTYIAKADRSFRKQEKELYLKFLKKVAGGGIKDEQTWELAVHQANSLETPSSNRFYKATKALMVRSSEYRKNVLDTAKAMLDSDKTITDEENRAFKYLLKHINHDAVV